MVQVDPKVPPRILDVKNVSGGQQRNQVIYPRNRTREPISHVRTFRVLKYNCILDLRGHDDM